MFRVHHIAAALVCSAVAYAQDKACTRQPASGVAPVIIMGHLDTVDPTSDLPTPYMRSVLASLHDAFRASGALPLVSYVTLRKDTVTFAMTTAVAFEITRDGQIQNAQVIATSLSGALDSIVLRALARVDSARSLLTLPRGVEEPAHLMLTTFVASDTGTGTADEGVIGPLIRTRTPVWTSFKLPDMLPNIRGPAFQPTARTFDRDVSATAEFVIDESGIAIPSTAYLSNNDFEEFGMSVVKWLSSPQVRYRPGMVGGCPAKWLVRQPFAYTQPPQRH